MRSDAAQIKCQRANTIQAVVNNGQQSAIALVQNKSKCIVLVQTMKLYGSFHAILFHQVCMSW